MVLDKKCKNCGAKVVFNPKTQQLYCEYCNSNHEITEETEEQIKESSKELDVYNCPSCGAQIICEPNTTSTFCVYCKNTAILKDKLKGEFFPQAIIPFHSTKEEAIQAFTDLKKGKRLIPNAFLDKKNIEEIRGIYIPFWFFDYEIDGHLEAKTEQDWEVILEKCVKILPVLESKGEKISFVQATILEIISEYWGILTGKKPQTKKGKIIIPL